MKMQHLIILFLSMLMVAPAAAQQSANEELPAAPDSISSGWSFVASAYYYILPEENNLTTLLGYATYRAVHLEARYNYEYENSVSVFGGYRFESGNTFIWGATPMIGGVFGNINGVIPGLELDLTWKKLDFYSGSEYVIDLEGKENNYFYTWSELAISPLENLRAGISASRTRLYQTDFDFQRGIFAEYSFWKLSSGVHYFNPFSSERYFIAVLDIEF